MKHRLFFLLPPLLLMGCSSGPEPVSAIVFEKNYYELSVGETQQLKTAITGQGSVLYFSGNEQVLTIANDGVATAVAPGEAVIYAVSNGLTAKASIRVLDEETTTSVVYVEGGLEASVVSPAFSAEFESMVPISFAFEDHLGGRFYVENSLPSGDLVNSILGLRNSPYITSNPEIVIPEGYDTLCTLIENAQGDVTCKSFYDEGILSCYVYDDGAYSGTAVFDLSENADAISALDGALSLDALSGFTTQDVLSILSALLDQGDIDTSVGALKLFKVLLYHSDILAHQEEDQMVISFAAHDNISEALFDYFGYDFGENPRISEAKASITFEKKDSEYQLTKASTSISATLFGASNSLEASFVPTKTEHKDGSFLDDIEAGLISDSEQA